MKHIDHVRRVDGLYEGKGRLREGMKVCSIASWPPIQAQPSERHESSPPEIMAEMSMEWVVERDLRTDFDDYTITRYQIKYTDSLHLRHHHHAEWLYPAIDSLNGCSPQTISHEI